MKVGSLVELVEDFNFKLPNVNYPVMGIIYTIEDIDMVEGEPAIILCEIPNENAFDINGFYEPYFDMKQFRELQPPMDISELIEESIYQTV
ncbi:hypothetical protein VF04_36700 [Nostoc linckia z7]|uniref:DUF4926 domain-containing protein n=1 Tax=Nostoc linckia z7 TaxID=1628745 RepID=A0ABX4KDU8_NOSLI|nr:hypothetical protein [Nostoc linckia]PHJ51674.1 hypothetical protein VF02_37825 [Nostoc linckia z1]PHJ59308.1 hypothetical protein VF05_32475 [Nostoc linckia z3]PHJ63633.1 hypothetical protein VF03_29985 [Nostoc linckia z2]PHJ70008.1 hypothetical protein VF06_37825 [Nostoc linckia z4]PHJ83473.1 hypothetical protein VF04_36700 [Nostoc linckia z7]